jgi:hypothetical protein
MRFPVLVAVLLLAFARPSSAEPCAHCPSPGAPAAERDRHALLLHGIGFAARGATLPPAGKGPPPFVHLVSVHVKGVWKGPGRDLVLRLDPAPPARSTRSPARPGSSRRQRGRRPGDPAVHALGPAHQLERGVHGARPAEEPRRPAREEAHAALTRTLDACAFRA